MVQNHEPTRGFRWHFVWGLGFGVHLMMFLLSVGLLIFAVGGAGEGLDKLSPPPPPSLPVLGYEPPAHSPVPGLLLLIFCVGLFILAIGLAAGFGFSLWRRLRELRSE